MTEQQFPALAQFCSAYFHQDWDLEAPDALGIIRNYLKDESISQVQQSRNRKIKKFPRVRLKMLLQS
jgi:hypothetical protein